MTRRAPLLLVAVVAAVAGCDELEETPRWLLTEPRVLAVRAEPPVLHPGASATLEALVVAGDGSVADLDVAWRACDPWQLFVDPAGTCAPDRALALPDGVLDPFDVLARFPPPPGAPLPDGLPIPPDDDEPREDDGDECVELPSLDLPVVAEVVVDGRRLYGIKRVPVTEVDAQRTNPAIGTVLLGDAPPGGPYAPDAAYTLAAEPAPGSLDVECDDGYLETENLRIHLYATGGELDDSNIDIRYDRDGNETAELTEWTSPASGTTTLWLVAIDRDGGVDWQSFSLLTR